MAPARGSGPPTCSWTRCTAASASPPARRARAGNEMTSRTLAICAAATVLSAVAVTAQGRGEQPAQPAPTPRAAAPIDLTGYWAAIVNEDWRWRMVTPPKGDYASLPLTDAAIKVANAWDPARDASSGEQCRGYGAAAV